MPSSHLISFFLFSLRNDPFLGNSLQNPIQKQEGFHLGDINELRSHSRRRMSRGYLQVYPCPLVSS